MLDNEIKTPKLICLYISELIGFSARELIYNHIRVLLYSMSGWLASKQNESDPNIVSDILCKNID